MLEHNALSVIGAGSYGSALAIVVASKGYDVCLYARDQKEALLMEQNRENKKYLPNIKFPATLKITSSLNEAVLFARDILLVVPSSSFVDIIKTIAPILKTHQRIVWATKGLEPNSGEFLSNIAQRELQKYKLNLPLAALSGPTFAHELASNMPTAIACAGISRAQACEDFVDDFCRLIHTPSFRVYKSHDILALQLGGAVKNVLAIGAGMSDGLGYGANARTALITRGHGEMIKLGLAMGASEKGFMGLSGLGDLMLTCTDNQSRNRRFGYMLGQGMKTKDALAQIGQVVEGYHMIRDIEALRIKYDLDLPICHEIYEVIINNKDGYEAARSLLARELTPEWA